MTWHFNFGVSVLSVLGIVIAACNGESTNVDHAEGGNTGASDNQGGSGSNSGGAAGIGNTTRAPSGGTASTGTATSAPTGGTASTGTATGGTSSGPTQNSGTIMVASVFHDQMTTAEVYAMFYTGPLTQCSAQPFGDCIYYTNCSQPSTFVSAGTLSITSPATGKLAANNISMVPNGDNSYTYAPLSGTFVGNESVHIAASGATVPAFSVDLTVPLALLVDSPASYNSGTIQVNKSSDLVIQFSRGTTGVSLVAMPLTYATSTEYVECTSEPGASTLTIPKAALAVAGPVLNLLTVATKDIVAGSYAVAAAVYMNAFAPDKQHPVTVEIN